MSEHGYSYSAAAVRALTRQGRLPADAGDEAKNYQARVRLNSLAQRHGYRTFTECSVAQDHAALEAIRVELESTQ